MTWSSTRRPRGSSPRRRGASRAGSRRSRSSPRTIRARRSAAAAARSGAAARAVLGGLWDRAPAVSGGAIARVIEEDLGSSPQALFSHWEAAPLASASLGQVHAARLARRHRGRGQGPVPRGRGGAARGPRRRRVRPPARRLRGRADARRPARWSRSPRRCAASSTIAPRRAAMTRFAEAWAGHRVLRFPRVIEELSSDRVLTMTRAKGKTSSRSPATAAPDVRRAAAARHLRVRLGLAARRTACSTRIRTPATS